MLILSLHAYAFYSLRVGTPFPNANLLFEHFYWSGVDLFFVLSAFLLALPLFARRDRGEAPEAWGAYFLRRWMRIAPPYYVAMVLALAVIGIVGAELGGIEDLVLHLLFLHSVSPDTFISINPVFWSLAVEVHFYLLLPVMIRVLGGRHWHWGLVGFAGVALLVRALCHGSELTWLNFTMPAFLAHFAIGILAARLFASGWRPTAPGWAVVPLVFLVLVVGPFIIFDDPLIYTQGADSWLANVLHRPLIGLGFAALVFALAAGPSVWATGLSTAPVRWIGDVSYSLYLMHLPVLILLAELTPVMQAGFAAWMLVGFAASVAVAALAYYTVERPTMSRRSATRSPTATTSQVTQTAPPAAPVDL